MYITWCLGTCKCRTLFICVYVWKRMCGMLCVLQVHVRMLVYGVFVCMCLRMVLVCVHSVWACMCCLYIVCCMCVCVCVCPSGFCISMFILLPHVLSMHPELCKLLTLCNCINAIIVHWRCAIWPVCMLVLHRFCVHLSLEIHQCKEILICSNN